MLFKKKYEIIPIQSFDPFSDLSDSSGMRQEWRVEYKGYTIGFADTRLEAEKIVREHRKEKRTI